jgi:hypothetical protein
MKDFDSYSPTFRLFSVPSFLEGMAMALDFGQTMPEFNTDRNPAAADAKAVAADWRAVGRDLARAMRISSTKNGW